MIELDEDKKEAREVWAWDTGDKAWIYGGVDVLPSGNLQGSTYPSVVQPSNPDRQYSFNIWELTPRYEMAMRVGILGYNPNSPKDLTSDFLHSVEPTEEPPIGWVSYNVERAYDVPQVSKPCSMNMNGEIIIALKAFNTVKTQGDTPGVMYLLRADTQEVVSTTQFQFQRSFLPRNVGGRVPQGLENTPMLAVVGNSWGDTKVVQVGSPSSIPECTADQNRVFSE